MPWDFSKKGDNYLNFGLTTGLIAALLSFWVVWWVVVVDEILLLQIKKKDTNLKKINLNFLLK